MVGDRIRAWELRSISDFQEYFFVNTKSIRSVVILFDLSINMWFRIAHQKDEPHGTARLLIHQTKILGVSWEKLKKCKDQMIMKLVSIHEWMAFLSAGMLRDDLSCLVRDVNDPEASWDRFHVWEVLERRTTHWFSSVESPHPLVICISDDRQITVNYHRCSLLCLRSFVR